MRRNKWISLQWRQQLQLLELAKSELDDSIQFYFLQVFFLFLFVRISYFIFIYFNFYTFLLQTFGTFKTLRLALNRCNLVELVNGLSCNGFSTILFTTSIQGTTYYVNMYVHIHTTINFILLLLIDNKFLLIFLFYFISQ